MGWEAGEGWAGWEEGRSAGLELLLTHKHQAEQTGNGRTFLYLKPSDTPPPQGHAPSILVTHPSYKAMPLNPPTLGQAGIQMLELVRAIIIEPSRYPFLFQLSSPISFQFYC